MSEVATPDAAPTGRALSPAQRSLWSSQLRYRDSALQNMALLTHIDGGVDADRLAAAFHDVVAGSDTLRLTIGSPDDAGLAEGVETVRVVARPPKDTEIVDLARHEAAGWARARVATPIDVSTAVYDSVVLRHDDGTSSWYLALHHVATDATSSALVYEATVDTYFGRPIEITSIDTASPAPSKRRQRAIDFWSERASAPLIDSLYRPVVERTPETHRLTVDLPPPTEMERALAGPYRMISDDLAWTTFLMTALAVHLHRISAADRFAVGLPIHHRTGRSNLWAIGPLMEVYPVDIQITPGSTFASLHRSISKSILAVVGHAVPGVGAGAADVSAIVNVIPRGGLGPFGDIPTSTTWIHPGAADPYHLAGLQLTTYTSGRPELAIDLNAAGADGAQRRRAPLHVRSIIDAMIVDPDAPIGQPTMVTSEEIGVLRSWGTGRALASDRFRFDPTRPRTTGSVLDRLSDSLRNSTRPAVVDGDRVLTGQELWKEASRVAASLADAGVGRGQRVGVELPRSPEAVVAILGVLLSGASYVPIDPTQPEARRVEIGRRAAVIGVLTDLDGLTAGPVEPRAVPVLEGADEAYVLFTSGSTGVPKGVPITHAGLADYLAFAAEHYLGPRQRRPVAPLFTSLGFDLTVTSLFLPLIGGGTVVVVADDGVPGLQQVARNPELTWIKATPSHLELLSRMLPRRHRIRTMVVGGEAFPGRLAAELAGDRPGIDVVNEYGPTEAVVGCMIHRWRPGDGDDNLDVPIGGPAPGVSLRIVDDMDNDVPVGVPGQLLISSPGLSPGYLDDVADGGPFRVRDGQRWYASGDIVRLVNDRDAVYLGRVDDQIKLNGVRLEPAEVVAAIEQHPAVRRAVVRLWTPSPVSGTDSDGEPMVPPRPILAAWVETDADLDSGDLRVFLLPRLASHQVPSAFAIVTDLAFNANGKLDVDALPSPQRARRATGAAEAGAGDPATERSRVGDAVHSAWRRALALGQTDPDITADDDFFVLGGDSLAALEMTAGVSDALGIEVPEGLVFSAATFADFAAVLESQLAAGPAIDRGPTPRTSGLPLPSPGEEAMLYEHRIDPTSPRYNIGRRFVVPHRIDPGQLRAAAEQVVGRHEPLRMTHGSDRRELEIGRALQFSVADLDGQATISNEVSLAGARALLEAPFDLDRGPLVRVALHHLDDGRDAIVVVMHHISGDAASLDRFWIDLATALDGDALEPLAIAYADHAAWQRSRDDGAEFWADLWTDPVTTDLGLLPPLRAEGDGYLERPASFSTAELRNGPGRTPTATALAALAMLLDRHHGARADDGQRRYAIGLAASVREHSTSEPMVGYFLNTLPLVVGLDDTASVADLANRTSRLLGAALPHRSHPYAEMVARARREGRQAPTPQVLLAVQDHPEATLAGVAVEQELLASSAAVAPATLFVQIRGERVDLGIEYSGSAVAADRAHAILDDFDALLVSGLRTAPPPVDLPSAAGSVLHGTDAASDQPLTAELRRLLDSGAASDRAARCGDAVLTRDELRRRSAQVAEQLRINGVGPGDRVAVSLGRSLDLVVGIVAVLRLGAVYVPVDPTYPEDRRRRILDAARPSAALVDAGSEVPWLPSFVVAPDAGTDPHFVDHDVMPSDEAYVIFTSGSTGVPKGVPVTHGQLATSTRARPLVYPTAPGRFLLLSSIGFDSSIVGLFWTLSSGGEIVIPTEEEAHDPDAVLSLIRRSGTTHVLMVPSLYRALLRRGASSDHWPDVVTVAGEACPSDLVERHHALRPHSMLVNEYGPTEGTVWTTAHECVASDGEQRPVPVPIGTPIAGSWCAVIDRIGRPVPFGASGELLIGGAGVTNGYLTTVEDVGDNAVSVAPELPFGADSPFGHGRTYRTGDAVAAINGLHGGPTLVFLGRVDDQLNVGGVRLEPGEVERVLMEADAVQAAAVVASRIGAEGDERELLVAHLEAGSAPVDLDEVRRLVQSSLPPPARPSRYVTHDRLPTTVHGKIDRAALSSMDLPAEPVAAHAVETNMSSEQSAVLGLFCRHLRADVGLDAGFFEAGGDSLAALTLAMDLEDHFGVDFSVTSLLAASTARAVASYFESEAGTDRSPRNGSNDAGTDLVEWIRRGDQSLPVLVLLAPGSGHLIGYEPMIAALAADIPILGVRLPGYLGKVRPLDRVEDIVDLIEPLLTDALRGHEAVVLGGSSGGLLAWELAARAADTGVSYRSVVLQDTVHPDWRREFDAVGIVDQLRMLQADEGWLAVVNDVVGRGQRKIDRWRIQRRSAARQVEGQAELPQAVARRMLQAANVMVAGYEPPAIDRPVTFFAAKNTDPDTTYLRWRPLNPHLDVQMFEGDHFGENGLAAAKNVGAVALVLEQLIRGS